MRTIPCNLKEDPGNAFTRAGVKLSSSNELCNASYTIECAATQSPAS